MPGIYAALGDTYRQNGLWEKAYQSYLKALEFTHSPGIQGSAAHIYGAIADLSLLQGRLRSAAQYWEKALASMQDHDNWGRLGLPVTGWIYIRTAELLYEWNQLDEAEDHLARGLERAVLGGDIRTQAAGNVLSARLFLARGAFDKADEAMETSRHLLEQAHFPQWTAHFDRCQVERWLAENRVRDAIAWYKSAVDTEAAEDRVESDAAYITAARVLTAAGDPSSLEQALRLLSDVYEDAENSGRGRAAVESLAIQALALRQMNDLPGALAALERALRKAEPEGYIRLFADLGLPMAELLQEIRARGIMQAYAERLLEALQVDYSRLPGSGQALPEPLTAREHEILQLLSAGLSNREIADKLVVSPETVKKHVSSIVGKLGTSNRTEAAARARTLGLLD
jgi:LuxR family maltose regulon positive regulatory protein